MLPEYGFDYQLIGPVCSFPDSLLATLLAPHSSGYPPVSVVVGRIRPHKVSSPNTLVTAVANVTRLNSVEGLHRI